MSKLSVVLPAYNEELMVGKTCRVLAEVLTEAKIPYELVVVNDGSGDRTWEEIQKAGERDANVTGVLFSRNFGKEAAIFAGLAQACGDVVAVMDCDLQHPPQTLIEMYRLWQEGYEVIEGVKADRGKEGFLHKECAGFFYDIMSKATKVNMKDASDFKMMDRKAVDSILSMPERNMFFRATSSWVGYKTTSVEFEVQEREAGVSKWSPWSLVKYAFTNIVAFTTFPLQFVTITGAICFICSLVLMVYSLVQYFTGSAVEGYTTLLMVLLLVGSAMMISLGIIGYYISKIYEEVKRRPRYIISKVIKHGIYRTERIYFMKQWIRKMYESSVIRYIFFGGCTTMVNLVSFFILRKLKVELNIANIISIILAILFAYVVNSKYVFQDKCETLKDHVQPFCKFVSARLVTMVIEVGGVWLLVSVMGLNDMIGKFLTQFIVLILNYVFSKFFVFTTGKSK